MRSQLLKVRLYFPLDKLFPQERESFIYFLYLAMNRMFTFTLFPDDKLGEI